MERWVDTRDGWILKIDVLSEWIERRMSMMGHGCMDGCKVSEWVDDPWKDN